MGSGSGTYLSGTGGRPVLRKVGASVESILLDEREDITRVSVKLFVGSTMLMRLECDGTLSEVRLEAAALYCTKG